MVRVVFDLVEFNVLGPVTVTDGSESLNVGGPKQRAVLAMFISRAGQPLSADAIAQAVYGPDASTKARRVVQTYVSSLKSLVGDVIAKDGASWSLMVDRAAVDATRFEDLYESARDLTGDAASDVLRAALAVWRGDPYADVEAHGELDGEITRLAGLRISVQQARIDADLESGRDSDLIGEIEALLAEHPYQERFRGQHMLALYRAGRQSEALRSFQQMREILIDELGVHPSPELQQLERRILEQDHSLLFAPRHPTGETGGAPADATDALPYVPTSFVGRSAELARLDDSFTRSPLVVLTGPGGSGKTRTAIEYARSQAHSFPDGAWFVELAPLQPDGDVMAAIGETLGLRPGEGADIFEVVRRYTRHRELLLVVDNCEHVLEGAARAIGEIVRVARDARVMATSRESLGVAGEQLIPLTPLELPTDGPADDGDHAAALELLVDRATQAGVDVSDVGSLARICVRLEGMPLAIELAAARLRTLSPAELAQRLDDSLGSLSAPDKMRPERHRTLRATVAWSYSLLTAEEQTALKRLSVFPSSFDLDAAEAIAFDRAVTDRDVLDMLDSLVDKSLVTATKRSRGPTRFSLLVPVREFAAEILADDGATDAVLLRHAIHYADLVSQAGPHTRGAGYVEWAERLRTEFNHVRLAARTLLIQGRPETLLDLAFELQTFAIHTGRQVELIEILLAAVDVLPQTDLPRRIKGLWVAAIQAAEITDPAAVGLARTGLELARRTRDPNLIGRMELALGAAIRHTSTDPEYLEHLVEGRRMLEADPEPFWWEPAWERGLLNFIIGAYLPRSDERIGEHFEIALDAFMETNDRVFHAAILGETAMLWGVADKDWILDNVRESVRLLAPLDTPYWSGHSEIALGVLLMIDGQPADAIPQFRTAAAKLIDCGDINCWALATELSADCELDVGELDTVHAQLGAVLDSIEVLPNVNLHKARTLDTAASLLGREGHAEAAAKILGCALGMEYPSETLIDRARRHDQVRSEVEAELGAAMTSELLADGAGLSFDESITLYRTATQQVV